MGLGGVLLKQLVCGRVRPISYKVLHTRQLSPERRAEMTASFVKRFNPISERTADVPGKLTDRFRVRGLLHTSISSSIVYAPAQSGVTINMFLAENPGTSD